MGMFGSLIDPQMTELTPAQRSTWEHALHRLLDDPLGKAPLQDEFGGHAP